MMASLARGLGKGWPRRGARAVSHLLGALGILLVVPLAHAQPANAARAAASERTELQWLQAIQSAAQRMNYSGTIMYQEGVSVRTSRVVHYFDGSVSHERLQVLDGRPREYIRRDAEVQCLYPESRRVQIERRPDPAFPSLGGGAPADILENYAVRLEAVERVAGYDCQVILLQPRDEARYGYRLCAELGSGLLLKAQTLNERREALDQMVFADVRIGERIDRSQLKPSWATDGWTVQRQELKPVDLAAIGWRVTVPPGFRKLREVGRTMPTYGKPVAPRPALQAVYSDGLATLSVFIETGAGSDAGAGEWTHQYGTTSGYSRHVSDARVVVIGEVPPATTRSVAQSVEFRASR